MNTAAIPKVQSARLPLHIQISELLTREIQAGLLADGEKLPPERELARSLDVSVGTLRKALQELEDKGMLARVHGSGNYINNKLDAENVYALFKLELIKGGGLPSADLLSVKRLTKPNNIPALGESKHAFRFRRLRQLNNTLVAAEEVWLDGSYATSISEETVSESLYLFYKDILGFWITKTEDRVNIGTLPEWAMQYWPNSDGVPFGYVERLSKDQDMKTAEFSRTWFDNTRANFVSR